MFGKIIKYIKSHLLGIQELPAIPFKLGCKKDPEDKRDHIRKMVTCFAAAPLQSKNLDNFSLKNFIPHSILNQTTTSACTGYSASYAVGILMAKLLNLSEQDLKSFKSASPTWIYFNARKHDGSGMADEGATIRSAIKSLKDPGSIAMEHMSTSYPVTKTPTEKTIIDAPKFKISEYVRINKRFGAIEEMKYILDTERLPIIAGILLYKKQLWDASYSGIVNYDNVNKDTCVGGHAICVTGYRHIKGKLYFEFVNSWGAQWGDAGFGYFPAEIVEDLSTGNLMDMWTFDKRYF